MGQKDHDLLQIKDEIVGHVRQRGVNSGVLEVAIGQAALGGIWAGCASLSWGLSSAMASTCM